MKGYGWYNISADGGDSWTTQYLTEEEAEAERQDGYIVVRDTRMTGSFARKPESIADLELAKRTTRPERIRAVAEVSLTAQEWNALLNNMYVNRAYIAEHTEKTGCEDGIMLCIIVSTPDDERKIAIEAEGYDYPRYAALVVE